MDLLPLPLPTAPDRDRSDRGHSLSPCVVCGRRVNPVRPLMVHVIGGGGTVAPASDTSDHGASDLGWLWIGPDCARLLPAGYAVRSAD